MGKKRSKDSGGFLKLVILLIIAFGLWSILQQDKETGTSNGNGHKYQVHKSGAGVTIDFVNASRDLDAVMIKKIKDSGFKYIVDERQTRQVPRESIEGLIQWENRHIAVAVPTEAKAVSFAETLSQAVRKTGGRILESYQDMIEDKKAMRYDIGFEDMLEGEPVRIITHNIWLTIQTDVPVAPPKEEIKSPASSLYSIPPNSDEPQVDIQKSKSPPSKQLGRLALVIDDFGLTMEGVADLMAIEQPLTFAILPHHAYSAVIARQAAAQGKEVILHLPMESIGGERAEPTTIETAMAEEQIKIRVQEALTAVPQVIGVNNHQGSKATADSRVMKAVLSVLQDRGMFFLDSRTSAASVAYRTAKTMGIPAAENDHFIDNSSDVEAIKRELRTAGNLAIRHDEAVAIGHIRPNTVIAIKAMLPELERMGVKLVFVSELAR